MLFENFFIQWPSKYHSWSFQLQALATARICSFLLSKSCTRDRFPSVFKIKLFLLRITGWSLSSGIWTERFFTFLNYISWSFLLKGILGHENLLFCLPPQRESRWENWVGVEWDSEWLLRLSQSWKQRTWMPLGEKLARKLYTWLLGTVDCQVCRVWTHTVSLETVTESLVGAQVSSLSCFLSSFWNFLESSMSLPWQREPQVLRSRVVRCESRQIGAEGYIGGKTC